MMRSILVAEDEAGTGEIIKTILEDAGFNVVLRANGEEAFEAYKQHEFSAVITDLNMPGIDG